MRCVKMNYRGVTFSVNPESIELEYAKKISPIPIPKKGTRVQEICFQPTVISGRGSFSGAQAEQEAYVLMRLFQEKGADWLLSPLFPPMKMLFRSLKLRANAEKGCIEFSFSFVEEMRKKDRWHDFGYTKALKNETLYDVANRCGSKVDRVFEANDYRDLFSVSEGDKVWLR